MVDLFPISASDPDFRIHSMIDSDLANANRAISAFLNANPGYLAKLRDLRRTNPRGAILLEEQAPNANQLYPQLIATTYRRDWLLPLARRFAWNRDHGQPGAASAKLIAKMISITITRVQKVNDAEFRELSEPAEALHAAGCPNYIGTMARYFADIERRVPLSPELLAAARKFLPLSEGSAALSTFGWALFRAESSLAEFDRGLSLRIHDDLGAMKKKDRALCLRLLDSPRNYAGYSPNRSFSSRSAGAKLGSTQIEERLRLWIGMLRQDDETSLSPIGALLFPHILGLCETAEGRACDELLYEVAKARWTKIPVPKWLPMYLSMLSRRPKDRAFACLEALMMNPVTATKEVQNHYEALASTFAACELPAAPVGVDGFCLDSEPALQPQQVRIDQLLQMGVAAVAQGPWPQSAVVQELARIRAMREEEKTPEIRTREQKLADLPQFPVAPEVRLALTAMENSIVEEFSADPVKLHWAATRRMDWILAHRDQYSADTLKLWWELFTALGCSGGLVQRSLDRADKLPLENLVKALQGAGGYNAFEMCQEYVAENGWCLELVEAVRKYIPSIGNALSQQVRWARAEWFLWFEDVCPVDLDACWSHRVKRDLREMPPADLAKWRALLDNNSFKFSGKPPKTWMNAAAELFPKVDPEDFRRRFVAWFQPFSQAEPLRLTVTGRNVLRVLMWYSLIAEDSLVDEALAGFAKAQWKTKDSEASASQAEMAFAFVLAQRAPEIALPVLEAYVSSGRAFKGSETHVLYEELCRDRNLPPVPAFTENTFLQESPKPPKPAKSLTTHAISLERSQQEPRR